MHEAKSNLSRLANMVQSGEKVIIAKSGRPYVELIPYSKPKKQRTLGCLKIKSNYPKILVNLMMKSPNYLMLYKVVSARY